MEEMLNAYAAAVRAKDVDAFLGLYADDVRNFDLWSEWSYDGKDALRGMVAEWFGSLPDDETVSVRFDDVRTESGADVAGVSAFTTFAAEAPDGTELRSMNNRLTWILRKDAEGSWKIAHEHTSAPAGDEGKVQLRR
ncbi:MAG TPA: SgcJ/EcaC family oxidoreductase [Gaiellaceae bacterium]|nr:SgcJ/EcaC family oxidoreductase [Gaiellaceae bacterium]